ncbi:MAG: hypothetical protein KFH98_05655 [Gemmatimonadetes bacterium]|nr:hypothetical protein [Gemmatimonadota bacterium]
MRTATAFLSILLVAACATDEPDPVIDDATTAEMTTTETLTVADFAGTWENVAMLEGVDEPVPSTMTGSAAGNDWTMSLEGRASIPLNVRVEGDSLIGESEAYESILRPGVMVTVRTASVLHGDMLMGRLVSIYQTADGEERVSGTIEGTRVP